MPTITLNVNSRDYSFEVLNADMPLLWALRDSIGLTGTKYGCGVEICGACTVWIDGKPEKSCDTSVSEAVGRRITTIEGLSPDPSNPTNPVQLAWINKQVPQCGYCQPGVIMEAAAALAEGSHGAGIASRIDNLCVCGTYGRMNSACASL